MIVNNIMLNRTLKPNLISNKTVKKINKICTTTNNVKYNNDLPNSIYDFYQKYINPNFFCLFVLITLIIVLWIQYNLKQETDIINNHVNATINDNIKTTKKNNRKKHKKPEEIFELEPIINESHIESNSYYDDDYNDQPMLLNDEYNNNILLNSLKNKEIEKTSFNNFAKILGGGNFY
jgi:hypothetical protein